MPRRQGPTDDELRAFVIGKNGPEVSLKMVEGAHFLSTWAQELYRSTAPKYTFTMLSRVQRDCFIWLFKFGDRRHAPIITAADLDNLPLTPIRILMDDYIDGSTRLGQIINVARNDV